ncbi:MAG: hypothetical protein KIH44_003545 [Octadecabacter sp.]|nr:hypothetical protein [Octadecabacter sp.]
MEGWYGDIDTFLYLSLSFGLLGLILPRYLFRFPKKPILGLLVSMVASAFLLLLLGAITSYFVHLKQNSQFSTVFREQFKNGISYVIETGIELVALGLIGAFASALVICFVDLRRKRKAQ